MAAFLAMREQITRALVAVDLCEGEYLSKASGDLTASLEMSGKPYLSTLYLLNVSMLASSGEERRHWLDTGNAIDPGNVLLRSRYMVTRPGTLQLCWDSAR